MFTKLLHPLVSHWRAKGIWVLMYINDGIVASKLETQCCVQRDMVVSDLERAGFNVLATLSILYVSLVVHQTSKKKKKKKKASAA